MANFSTHLVGAVGVGVVATAVLVSTELLPPASLVSGVALVALGGLFPDVDSDHSDAVTLVFDTLALAVAIPVMILAVPQLGLLGSLVLLGLVAAAFRYVLVVPFRWWTVHRGRFHSLPMGALLACVVAGVDCYALGGDTVQAWVLGSLFALGFAVHLVLDELYAVDLGNRKLKLSFGSAFKLLDRSDLFGYGVLYGLLALGLWLAPSPEPFARALAEVHLQWLPPDASALAAG